MVRHEWEFALPSKLLVAQPSPTVMRKICQPTSCKTLITTQTTNTYQSIYRNKIESSLMIKWLAEGKSHENTPKLHARCLYN